MFVYEIVIPGTWLDYDDRDWAFKIQNMLRSMESQFFDANASLNLFLGALQASPSVADRADWERDSQRRSEIRRAIERERGSETTYEDWVNISFEVDVVFKREKWSSGKIPREFSQCLPLIYACSFLCALDAFEKYLGVLSKEENVPEQVVSFHSQMAKDFPSLRGVRNSVQHPEDRSRGLGTGNKPLDLKPIENEFISAPGGGVLVLNCLNGTRYGSTMADGHYGEVDVSPASMERMQDILQGILTSFKWHGSKRHAPGV